MAAHDPSSRFWARVDTSAGPSACWPWQGSRTAPGRSSRGSRERYGKLSVDGRTVRAHRFALEASGVVLAPGMLARHTCHNPICCNPAHLTPGDTKANADDREHAGRAPRSTDGRFVALKHMQTRQTATIDMHAHDAG